MGRREKERSKYRAAAAQRVMPASNNQARPTPSAPSQCRFLRDVSLPGLMSSLLSRHGSWSQKFSHGHVRLLDDNQALAVMPSISSASCASQISKIESSWVTRSSSRSGADGFCSLR